MTEKQKTTGRHGHKHPSQQGMDTTRFYIHRHLRCCGDNYKILIMLTKWIVLQLISDYQVYTDITSLNHAVFCEYFSF